MEYKRSQRIAELIHRTMTEIIQTLKDPRIGFLTITNVLLTDDLRDARVYYSVLGSISERNNTTEALKSALSYIRREIGLRLDLRVVPTIEFFYDDSAERSARVLEIIQQIKNEEQRKNVMIIENPKRKRKTKK